MKINVKARVWVAVCFTVVSLFFWWLSGFNFNERGGDAMFCFFTTVASML